MILRAGAFTRAAAGADYCHSIQYLVNSRLVQEAGFRRVGTCAHADTAQAYRCTTRIVAFEVIDFEGGADTHLVSPRGLKSPPYDCGLRQRDNVRQISGVKKDARQAARLHFGTRLFYCNYQPRFSVYLPLVEPVPPL